MFPHNEIDIVIKGRDLYWTILGKMRGESLVLGDISYVKSENDKGVERIFSVNIEDNQEFRVQQMISFIKAGIMPDSMLITPNTKPVDLAERLSHKGFIIDDTGSCMLMYLDNYKKIKFEHADFVVSDIMGKKQLSEWVNILSEALFEGELITVEQFKDIMTLDNTYFYIGLLNGKPVTTCMTIVDGDTSTLEFVSTLKEYRRRGFASAVMNKAFMDLRQKGVKTVALNAEPDGISVYNKLGFKECFKRVVASCDWNSIYRK